MKKINHIANSLVMLALALTACGGGGGSQSGTVDDIPNNTHSKSIIEGDWYDSNNNHYYFDGTGDGRYYWRPEITDMTCFLTYNVQGSGEWGTVFIKATYHNYTGHTTWREEESGSYNVSEGRMIIGGTTYRRK